MPRAVSPCPACSVLFAILAMASIEVGSLAPAVAGVNTWSQLGPEGGDLCALAVAPSDPTIVYAVGTTYFRSSDGGRSWESTGARADQTACALTVDAFDPLLLYSVHPDGLLRSFDGGSTWVPTDTPFPAFYSPFRIAVDRHDVDFLLISTPGGVYRSRDRGYSWQLALHADHPFLSVAIHPAIAGRGFALSQFDGVLVTTDYGDHWAPSNAGLPTDDLGGPQLAFDPADPALIYLLRYASIYRSRDGGASWALIRPATQPFAIDRIAVAADSTVFALPFGTQAPPSEHREFLRSTDEGGSWQVVPDPFPSHPGIAFTDFAGVPGVLLATSQFGFLRSDDSGETWQESDAGLLGSSVAGFGLDRENPERLFGVEPFSAFRPPGILRSLDRGTTWQHLPVGISEPGLDYLADLVVDPNDPRRYLGLEVGTQANGFGGVASSTDAGETWSAPFRGPFVCPPVPQLIVDPLTSNRLYLLAGLSLGPCINPCLTLTSDDSGENWSCIEPAGTPDALQVLEPSPFEEGVVLASGYTTLFRSANFGHEWTVVAGSPTFLPGRGGAIAWASADRVYVTSDEAGVYFSDDGGRTWAPRALPPQVPQIPRLSEIAVDPFHPSTLYALPVEDWSFPARAVVESRDGGLNWGLIAADLLNWSLSSLTVDPVTPNRVYVSADGGGILAYDIQEPEPCVPSATALCVTDSRFKIESLWRDFAGHSGVGHAMPLAADSGSFWFFDPANLELFVKEIDGTGYNDAFWTFYGSLSNVEFTVLATDTETGAEHGYFNPSRQFASRGDIDSFPQREGLDAQTALAQPAIFCAPAHVAPQRSSTACVANSTTLCLQQERFAASVTWQDFTGHSGTGTALPLTPDTGSFWFFDAGIHELAVKVIDGRDTNDAYWVFYGSLSNVEFELTLVDTATGATWTRSNPSGTFASNGDIEAFPQLP